MENIKEEEFNYGELAKFRDWDDQNWVDRYYVSTFYFDHDNSVQYYSMHKDQNPDNHDGDTVPWRQIQKINFSEI